MAESSSSSALSQRVHFLEEEGQNGLDLGQGILSVFFFAGLPDLVLLESRLVGFGVGTTDLEAFPQR